MRGPGLILSFLLSVVRIAYGQHKHDEQTSETATNHSAMEHADMQHSDMGHHEQMSHGMTGLYGSYSMSREASGTSWQPEATPMGGLHIMHDEWMVMLHGSAFGVYDYQSGRRGDRKFFSPNMLMGMAEHPLGPGTFGFRSMLSLEAATIGRTGYPE
jgi:hypothetical protein